MTIELNNTNCKDYTTEELNNILGLNEVVEDFDLDVLFGEEAEEEIEEEIKLTDFQKLTLSLLNEAKEGLKLWEAKSYKKSEGSAYVGSEIDGGSYSFNHINNKRKNNMIKNFTSDINLYTNDLKNTGYKF